MAARRPADGLVAREAAPEARDVGAGARGRASVVRLLPGLVLTASLAGGAFALARVPGVALLGPLGLSLVLGAAWRLTIGLGPAYRPGARLASRTLLRVGVVLLGARLHYGSLWEAGPRIVALDLAVVVTAILVMEGVGRMLRLRRGLRLSLAIGTAVCGASAIAAAAPIVGARDDEVSTSVGIISVLGALAAVGFTLVSSAATLTPSTYGVMIGATLQEVGHVVAAGASAEPEALDLAVLTKLTRVALLAPVLLATSLVLARLSRRRSSGAVERGADGAARPLGTDGLTASPRAPLVPAFLVGFLLLGVANSAGLVSPAVQALAQTGSAALLSVAMAGIGLQIDAAAMRRGSGRALVLAVAGFALLLVVAGVFVVTVGA